MNAAQHESANAHRVIPIFIDDTKFGLQSEEITGAELRALVSLGVSHDLWLDVPGPQDDILIRPESTYHVKPGTHFYTAPSTINPGAC